MRQATDQPVRSATERRAAGPGLSWGCHDRRFVLFGAVTDDMVDDFVDALERAAVEPKVESVDLRGLDYLTPTAVDALVEWRERYGGRLPIEAATELDSRLGNGGRAA